MTPYNYAENSPIANIDLWGLQKYYAADGNLLGQVGTNTAVRVINSSLTNQQATTLIGNSASPLQSAPESAQQLMNNSVAFADYFTSVSDVINDELVVYQENVCNCNCSARTQMSDAGVSLSGGVINTIVDVSKDPNLTADPIGGAIYIQTQLNNGKPVMVGLQEAKAGETTPQDPGNTNSATGHFVVAVGTDVSATGEKSFRYYDNASSVNGKSPDNKLQINLTTGIAEDSTPANTNKSYYKISEVRKNQ